jgi:hypothetical protein
MSINIVTHDNKDYPFFQTQGNASKYIIPFALEFCKGTGYDIGYCKKEWMFPNAIGIDYNDNTGYHADNLPEGQVDYIFSSHCLEHVDNWINTLEYWVSKIKKGGVIFLYLPDYSQTYWRPWNNRKHKHVLIPDIISDLLKSKGCTKIFKTGVDLNNSFTIVCEV